MSPMAEYNPAKARLTAKHLGAMPNFKIRTHDVQSDEATNQDDDLRTVEQSMHGTAEQQVVSLDTLAPPSASETVVLELEPTDASNVSATALLAVPMTKTPAHKKRRVRQTSCRSTTSRRAPGSAR